MDKLTVQKSEDTNISNKTTLKENSIIANGNDLVWTGNSLSFNKPLMYTWEPKEDITTYELALCLPYFSRLIFENEVDLTLPHFRHFNFVNHNNKEK